MFMCVCVCVCVRERERERGREKERGSCFSEDGYVARPFLMNKICLN